MVEPLLADFLYFITNVILGSRGPAVLDDFTASYGYKFSDPAGYQWPVHGVEGKL